MKLLNPTNICKKRTIIIVLVCMLLIGILGLVKMERKIETGGEGDDRKAEINMVM